MHKNTQAHKIQLLYFKIVHQILMKSLIFQYLEYCLNALLSNQYKI